MILDIAVRRALFAAIALALTTSVPALAGQVALNPDVRQETISTTICVPGYTASVRPASSFTNAIKHRLLAQAGHDSTRAADYALDHIVPLALGGHPSLLENLQLEESAEAKRKDRIEVKLQCLVCSGQVSLGDAQRAIMNDWEAAYHRYAPTKCHRHRSEEE
jgi:cytochrome c-type biogenesis protein CcmH/NrfF